MDGELNYTHFDWGHVQCVLYDYLQQNDISMKQFCSAAHIKPKQFKEYCSVELPIQRVDLNVLARICYVLECQIDDILKYIPPSLK